MVDFLYINHVKKGKIMMKHAAKKSIILLLLSQTIIQAIDNPHFWRATNFLSQFYEPRFAYNWLSSLDVYVGAGSSSTGRDFNGHKVPLLDIYGTLNAQALGINVPGKDMSNPGDLVMTQLTILPANDGFAHLSFGGKFKLIEANFCYSQNFGCGFFLQAHIPVRRMEITNIKQTDLSPIDCDNGPNIDTPAWQSFLALFPSIINKYQLSIAPFKKTGIGDLSILCGWTNNYEETQEIDYFDSTFRFGVLFPTGRKKDIDVAFDIANGYDGFYAIPIAFDAAAGWYDWFTLGIHIGTMPFLKDSRLARLKTDFNQAGFIKLAVGRASIHPGTIWEANAYMIADHVLCGLSFLAGYSFATQNKWYVSPEDSVLFPENIVNSDEQFLGWKMHTINLMLDYDFATYDHPWYPHLGFFYNIVIGGERIFNTNVGGIEFGVNIGCNF